MKTYKKWLPWAGMAAACALPFLFTSSYMHQILNMMLINGIITIGLYVIFGLTGIFSVAQAAFWGIGAYTAALLATRLGVPWYVCFLAAPIVPGSSVSCWSSHAASQDALSHHGDHRVRRSGAPSRGQLDGLTEGLNGTSGTSRPPTWAHSSSTRLRNTSSSDS